jgi:hypothetical protein
MGICRLDIPARRRDFAATRAAPLRDYASLIVLEAARVLGQSSRGLGLCLTRQPSTVPIVRFHYQRRFLGTRRKGSN